MAPDSNPNQLIRGMRFDSALALAGRDCRRARRLFRGLLGFLVVAEELPGHWPALPKEERDSAREKLHCSKSSFAPSASKARS